MIRDGTVGMRKFTSSNILSLGCKQLSSIYPGCNGQNFRAYTYTDPTAGFGALLHTNM